MAEFPGVLAHQFLNMNWLRPENVVWDSKAAMLLNAFTPRNPCLDLGSGNGLTMFVAAGGQFDIHYDWYINTDVKGFLENSDIYDTFTGYDLSRHIIKAPASYFDFAFDHKKNLIRQAMQLKGFYRDSKVGSAEDALPFADKQFLDVYTNILYWLKNPASTLAEIGRIMRPAGRLLACVPTDKFFEHCPSYSYSKAGKYSKILKLINRGRGESHKWAVTADELARHCNNHGLKLVSCEYYLSPESLLVWDVGMRPFSPVLIRMANALSKDERAAVKKEWMEHILVFARELWTLEESANDSEKGFALMVFEKT